MLNIMVTLLAFYKVAVATLRKPVMICASSNSHRQFGGRPLPPDMVDRCLCRMAAWVRLVAKSILAEFPSWQMSGALLCYCLGLYFLA